MGMVEHARNMLAYDVWANERALASIETIPAEKRSGPAYERACGLVPHVIIARRVWLMRIRATPHENPRDWFPAWAPAQTRAQAGEVDGLWGEFLGGLSEDDLASELSYTTSDGTRCVSTVGDVLVHVFNHGTYHRGQIARIVTELGGQRASTDHILLSRKKL